MPDSENNCKQSSNCQIVVIRRYELVDIRYEIISQFREQIEGICLTFPKGVVLGKKRSIIVDNYSVFNVCFDNFPPTAELQFFWGDKIEKACGDDSRDEMNDRSENCVVKVWKSVHDRENEDDDWVKCAPTDGTGQQGARKDYACDGDWDTAIPKYKSWSNVRDCIQDSFLQVNL